MHDRDPERVLAGYDPDVVRYILAQPLRFVGFDVDAPRGPQRAAGEAVGAPEGFGGFELWMRATVGLRKIDGGWRITHHHESTPLHMDMGPDGSFRAATDLQP